MKHMHYIYLDRLPFDQDNDLTMIAGHRGPSVGMATDLPGLILDLGDKPLRGVVIGNFVS